MAGNPLAKLFPYIKKYVVEIYIGVGVLTFAKHQLAIKNTFRSVYSKNEFERHYYLDKMKALVSEHKH